MNSNSDDKLGLVARRAALDLLFAVQRDSQSLAVLRESEIVSRLAPQDAARGLSLATSILRHLGPIDQVIAKFVSKRPSYLVQNILRIAAQEILVDKIADYAAVNAAVALAKRHPKGAHSTGLINAVARKIASEGPAVFETCAPTRLAKQIRHRLLRAYGSERVEAFERAHAIPAPIDLTLKEPANAQKWAETLGAEILPTGSIRLRDKPQISAMAGFSTGDWWVQDAAAALAVRAIGALRDKRVLDLCAAPGGKTMQLAAMGAKVTALDISAGRMGRVKENLERTKLQADTVVADALDWTPQAPFDVILVDAPCSATGTFRRHPDLNLHRASGDLKGVVGLQRKILSRAANWLAPEGVLLFVTCSLFHEEGEEQADWFLQNHPQMAPVAIEPEALGLDASFAAKRGAIRTSPEKWAESGGMDGFFLAKFTRSA